MIWVKREVKLVASLWKLEQFSITCIGLAIMSEKVKTFAGIKLHQLVHPLSLSLHYGSVHQLSWCWFWWRYHTLVLYISKLVSNQVSDSTLLCFSFSSGKPNSTPTSIGRQFIIVCFAWIRSRLKQTERCATDVGYWLREVMIMVHSTDEIR